jgi:hypothetical protein
VRGMCWEVKKLGISDRRRSVFADHDRVPAKAMGSRSERARHAGALSDSARAERA